MQAVALFLAVALMVGRPAAAVAAPAACDQIVQNLNAAAAAIDQDATSYNRPD
jgi:hypothetical protein